VEVLLLLTAPLSWPQIAGGWGAGVIMQVVADIYLPYFIPPGDPGGGGEGVGEKLPTRSIANSGPQPLARKVDWLLRKVDWLLKKG
jgi:hypothetical protein